MDGKMNNSTNTTTTDPLYVYDGEWPRTEFIGCMLSVTLSILGILGNILSFRVLQHCRPKCSYIFILQALAVADAATVFSCLLKSIEMGHRYYTIAGERRDAIFVFHVCISACENWGGIISNWLLVVLSVDRFLFASNPFKAATWCRIARLKLAIVLIVLGSFLLSALPTTLVQLFGRAKGLGLSDKNLSDEDQKLVMTACATLYFLPIFILLTVNAKLVCTVKKASRYHGNLKGDRSLQKKSLIINLIVIVIIFLICATSRLSFLLFHQYFYDYVYPSQKSMVILDIVTDRLVIFNHATNVLVYFFFYRRFRVMLKDMCCKKSW